MSTRKSRKLSMIVLAAIALLALAVGPSAVVNAQTDVKTEKAATDVTAVPSIVELEVAQSLAPVGNADLQTASALQFAGADSPSEAANAAAADAEAQPGAAEPDSFWLYPTAVNTLDRFSSPQSVFNPGDPMTLEVYIQNDSGMRGFLTSGTVTIDGPSGRQTIPSTFSISRTGSNRVTASVSISRSAVPGLRMLNVTVAGDSADTTYSVGGTVGPGGPGGGSGCPGMPAPLNHWQSGLITDFDDSDTYCVTPNGFPTLRVYMEKASDSSALDSYLIVYDDHGLEVTRDDDGGEAAGRGFRNSLAVISPFLFPSTYYRVVATRCCPGTTSGTGSYFIYFQQ